MTLSRQVPILALLCLLFTMPWRADAQEDRFVSLRSMGNAFDFSIASVDSIVFRTGADSMAVDLPLLLQLVNDNREQIGANRKRLDQMMSLVGSETKEYISRPSTRVDNWIYGKDKYVGYNKPAREDAILERMEVRMYGLTAEDVGTCYDFAVGVVDHRNWLLPRVFITAIISEISDGVATFVFSNGTNINAGESVFIKTVPKGLDASLGINAEATDEACPLYVFDDIGEAGRRVDYDLSCFHVYVKTTGKVFALKSEVDNLSERISLLGNELSELGYVKDKVTGERYRLEVADGQVIAVPTTVKRILAIGHSFVNYTNSPSVGWYLDDGESRAMAASVYSHQWTSFVGDRLGASVDRRNCVDFERNYSPSYDFAANWNVSDDYDAICVFMGENVTEVTADFHTSVQAAMQYLKASAPHATVYWSSSWHYGDKYKAMRDAAMEEGVVFVDVTDTWVTQDGSSTIWQKGDYYLGRDDAYYPIGPAYTHPNDMGHLGIANKYLQAMGYDAISQTVHRILLDTAGGGKLSTPNTSWPEGGVVTIRINADEGYAIDSMEVLSGTGEVIETTMRTNDYHEGTLQTYYTFIMPKADVVVKPVWKRI